jgi:hypothetical protein
LAEKPNKKMKTLIITLAGLASAGAAFASVDPTRPMVTGRGNVTARPAQVIVTNQTSPTPATPAKADETISLEKFQVTGSLLPHVAAPAPKK